MGRLGPRRSARNREFIDGKRSKESGTRRDQVCSALNATFFGMRMEVLMTMLFSMKIRKDSFFKLVRYFSLTVSMLEVVLECITAY